MNKHRSNLIFLAVVLAGILALLTGLAILTTTALADAPPQMDYMEIMIQAVVDQNPDMGHWAEQQRAEKIAALGLHYPLISWDDLDLLSRLVWQEAGADGISHEWRRDVAQVVLNRVASPEFPDDLESVIYQRGQYSGAATLTSVSPTRECVEAALEALEGKGDLPESVVFQANFRQGSGVYRQYYLSPYGTTYFCISSRPELY